MFKFNGMNDKESAGCSEIITREFDRLLMHTLEKDSDDLGEILPSDRLFYTKVTEKILPDETSYEEASRKLIETGLALKADDMYEPTDEQIEIIRSLLRYTGFDRQNVKYAMEELFGNADAEDVINILLGE